MYIQLPIPRCMACFRYRGSPFHIAARLLGLCPGTKRNPLPQAFPRYELKPGDILFLCDRRQEPEDDE